MPRISIQRRKTWPLLAVLALSGCQSVFPVYDAEFARLPPISYDRNSSTAVDAALSPVLDELTGPQPVETYIRYALAQNTSIQVARKRIEAAAMRVPQVASLEDPVLDALSWPIYPNVPQVASGRMTVDVSVSQKIPWYGKLETRACAAEADVNAARAQLAAVELQTIEEVKRAYYELYFAEQAARVTRQDHNVLADLIEVSTALYRTGKSSQQDVLRLQAELSNVDGELVRLRQMQSDAQADLAQLLHISPDTPLSAVEQLSPEDVPRDLGALYRQAVACRPELHALLAEIDRDRHMVELARLEYIPDPTFTLGWGGMTTNRAIAPTADGIDNLAVGLSLNLPIYRQRLKASVRETEATAMTRARQYDQFKDETQRDVKQLFAQANSQRELEQLFRNSIIPRTQQALEVAVRGYQVGDTEFADLITNWRELLRFRVTHLQFEMQLRQTLASLERTVGGLPEWSPAPDAPAEAPPKPNHKIERLPPPDDEKTDQAPPKKSRHSTPLAQLCDD